jgi:hypothetical protein
VLAVIVVVLLLRQPLALHSLSTIAKWQLSVCSANCSSTDSAKDSSTAIVPAVLPACITSSTTQAILFEGDHIQPAGDHMQPAQVSCSIFIEQVNMCWHGLLCTRDRMTLVVLVGSTVLDCGILDNHFGLQLQDESSICCLNDLALCTIQCLPKVSATTNPTDKHTLWFFLANMSVPSRL